MLIQIDLRYGQQQLWRGANIFLGKYSNASVHMDKIRSIARVFVISAGCLPTEGTPSRARATQHNAMRFLFMGTLELRVTLRRFEQGILSVP